MEVEGNNRRRIASLRFEFLPRKSYKDRFCVTQERVLRYFENKFIHKVRQGFTNMMYIEHFLSVILLGMFSEDPRI